MKQIKHMILLCLFCLTGMATQAETGPANTEIWYTATSIVTPTNILGTGDAALTVISNDYDASTGIGKITFNDEIITIGEQAFTGCSALSSITIPASVTSIGTKAFYQCYDSKNKKTGLATVSFAEDSKLTTIGNSAFEGCSLLSSPITIPANVTSIGTNAFSGCSQLATVAFAEGSKLETIGNSAFNGCSALPSITIPANVTSIGTKAFYGCSKLATVAFAEGSKLETIGDQAFTGCSALSSITIPASVTSIGNSVFNRCSALSSISIPANVTSIGTNAFGGLSQLATVAFAEGSKLETIGEQAFTGCSALSSITIPASVTSIGTKAFYQCYDSKNKKTGLATVSFAEDSKLTTIGNSAFEGCSLLSSPITIPASVTSIGNYAFSGCSQLATVAFAEGSKLETIGNSAFNGCSALSSITIPASVTSIGTYAFYNCSVLESISVDAGNTVYSSPNDCNAIIERETNTLIQGCKNTVIPESVETIGASAFRENGILESIAIPASVTSIGNYAFSGCSKLAIVTFAEGSKLETIGNDAFRLCSLLSSPITIPASVKSIGDYAFSMCSKLATVTFAEDSKLETIGYRAFQQCYGLSSITIPASVTSIGGTGYDAFSDCYFISFIINNKDLADIAEEKKYWGALICNNDGLIIENNVLTKCAKWVTSVTIPESVTGIGYEAFKNCSELVNVTFAEGSKLETIGNWAFSYCTVLSSITIPASVKSIGNYAFWDCSKLATVAFAEGSKLETIGNSAFFSCSVLSSITIPASVTSIETYAFQNCSELVKVTFAEGSKLETIGNYAFYNCSILSSITIPASVTSIGSGVFSGCSGIESVTLNWTEADKIVTITNAALQLQTGSTLLVPAGTEDLYAANESWSGFKDYMKPYITANQDPNNKKDYYATFYSSSKAYKLPDGVTAYTGVVEESTSNPNVSVLKLTPIADNIIPADVGVVLKLTSTDDTEAKVHFLVEESTEAGTKDTKNALTGTDVKCTATQDDYALSSGNNGVGFYPFCGKTIGAHKAYLTLNSSSPTPAKAFIFQFDDGTVTGIPATTLDYPHDDAIYNLQGQKVDENYNGVVIKNGQKMFNR